MKSSRREIKYAMEHFNEVHHTTLNPDGPGVIRIHMVPPEVKDKRVEPSVVILNGQDIITINELYLCAVKMLTTYKQLFFMNDISNVLDYFAPHLHFFALFNNLYCKLL